MSKHFAIIVAGGSGTRMGSATPKQFLPLLGSVVLFHSLKAFHESGAQIVLVLPADQIKQWESLCDRHSIEIPHRVVQGGSTRFGSVKNGIKALSDEEGIVAIHDGVRPLVSQMLIENCFRNAQEKGSAIPVVPVVQSIRRITPTGSVHEDRSQLRAVQTPQCFHLSTLSEIFEHTTELPSFTDDASVWEHAGKAVHLVEGEMQNIKITTPVDLTIAEAIARS